MSELELKLRLSTPDSWAHRMIAAFDEFLLDHASNERKASATAMNLVVKYPDRKSVVTAMISHAREELLHFQQVTKIALDRGLQLKGDGKCSYIGGLMSKMRNGRDEHFLDRLLTFAIVEARGHERFGLIAKHLPESELKDFYSKLTFSEERHFQVFLDLAAEYFPNSQIASRLREFEEFEADILSRQPIGIGMHFQ